MKGLPNLLMSGLPPPDIRCSVGRELLHHGLSYEQRSEQQGLPTRVGVAEETRITIYDLFYYSSFACNGQQGLE